jgi:predicted Zn finger-like uncharacterized protein
MVISCPECSTRFRVDEGKIPAQGAKIRCARCKHIFTVTPPAPEPEPLTEEPVPSTETRLPVPEEPFPTDEPALAEESAPTDKPTVTNDVFGFDDVDSPEIGAGANDDIDPSAFDDATPDDDAFSFGGDYGNVTLGDEPETTEENEPFSFGEPAPAVEQEQFSFSSAEQPTTSAPDPLADSFKEDATLDDSPIPPSEDEEEPFSPVDAPEMSARPQTSKPSSRSPLSVVISFLLILVLAILIAVGVVMWKNGPAGVERLISQLTGQPVATKLKGDIRLKNLQGSFITNRKEGELFVIQGIAVNNLSDAQAAIQVKGVIFDKDGKQLLQKTIFCGNPISDSDLRKLPYSKMEEIMGNQFGESLANLNVTPNQSIPFTIVFRKLPKTLSEFVVEVADTKPAAQ